MTPDEIATEFILTLRHAQFTSSGHVDEWKILGRTVARRTGEQAWASARFASGYGSPVQVTTAALRRASSNMFMAAVAPLVSRDARGHMFLVPTMDELTAAFAATESNDVEVIVSALGLTENDSLLAERLWTRTNRSRPHEHRLHHVSEADYIALRAAARQADVRYMMALLDAGLPVSAVIELCALPPMPVEYAIAMFDGGAA